ncbi:MAG: DNA/RNA nuclease SfsA [Tissierellia bacterium]|nr:DNA/RNA nuclease SfsA [Tissierellia bacterium]
MYYSNIVNGTFIYRANRFLAYCLVNGEEVACHVPNTSRLKELFIKGAPCVLQSHNNDNRKTKFTIIHIEKNKHWINIDSQSPNELVFNKIKESPSIIGLLKAPEILKREVKYGNSRFDIYYESGDIKGFVEVKGVTLEEDSIAMFPGAPTTRGTKHLKELILAKSEGYRVGVFFCVQIPYARFFRPHFELDSDFSKALVDANEAGVGVYAYNCFVNPNYVSIKEKLEILNVKSK